MHSLFYNDYLLQTDLIYRHKLKTIHKIPKLLSFSINFSLNQYIQYTENLLNVKFSDEKVCSNFFMFFYILFLNSSFISYKNNQDVKEFLLKVVFNGNKQGSTLLFDSFNSFYKKYLSIFFKVNKKNRYENFKISFLDFFELDLFINKFLS